MASKAKLRWQSQFEDELRTRFVCPDVLHKQLADFAGCQQLSQLGSAPSTQDAQQYFERAVHLQSNGVFGPHAPKTNSAQAKSAELHALLLSHSKRVPGLSEVLRLCKSHQQSSKKASSHEQQQPSPCSSPLLRLLRRVSLWYYYRVMFDPLDQLVQLNSSYELLFQLLTPHQQLSCMADILLVLSCPALAGQSGQLDTPLHTATLLSMLKMAQQLAEAEAQLQEQQQHLHSVQEQLQAQQGRDQNRDSKFVQVLQQQHKQHHQQACAAAGMLTTPGLALLQLSRQQSDLVTGVPQKAPLGLWPKGCRTVQGSFLKRFGVLVDAARQQDSGRIDMLGSLEAQAALQQSTSCKAVGALLSQLSLLPQKQLLLWWHSQEPSERPEPEATHTATVAHWLQRCCSALQLDPAAGLEPKKDEDPISTLMLWVMRALAGSGSSEQQQQQRRQQQQQGSGSDQQHPAEALRQVLDVLLSALQYRHGLAMQEWEVRELYSQPQKLLLSALHCHCMQLLTQARQQLPPEVCTLQHSNGSGSSGSRAQQQQQQAAWRLCCSQVQHNLLLVLQLTTHWQKHNACGSFQLTLYKKLMQMHLVAAVIDPVPGGDLAMAYQRARHITVQNFEGLQKKSLQKQQQQSGAKADAVPPAVLELLHVCMQSSDLQRTLSRQVPGKVDSEALGLCRMCGCDSVEELAGLLKVAHALAAAAVPPCLQRQHVADDTTLVSRVVDLYCTSTRTFAELTKQLELVLAALGCKQHKEALLKYWRAAAAPLWQTRARELHRKLLSAHSSAAFGADDVAVQQAEHNWAAASGADVAAEDASSTAASVLRLVGGAGGSTAGSSVAAEQVTTEFDSDNEMEQQLQEFELGSWTAWQDAAGPQLPSLPNTQLQQQPGESDDHSSNDSGSDSSSLFQLPGQVRLPSAGAACAGAAPLLGQEDEAAAGRSGSSNPPRSPLAASPHTGECSPAGAAAGHLESLYHSLNVLNELNSDAQWPELEEDHPDGDVTEWLQQLASGHWSGVNTGVEAEDHCRTPVDTVDQLGRDLPAGSHASQGAAAHSAAAAAAVVEAAAVQAVHEDSSESSRDSSSDTSSSNGTEEDLSQIRSRTSRTHSSSVQAPIALLQAFYKLLAFWKERLNKQSKHRYQHQKQQQHSSAPQVSPKDLDRVYLTGRRYLFQGMELSAATPWVELALAACSTEQHRLRPHLCRALMYLQRLGLPAPSSDTGSDRESQRQGSTDQPGYVHTLLTLLLTADGTAACRTSQQQELWQQGHSAMVALLDAVYTEVCNRCKYVSVRVESFGREAYEYIVRDLKQLTTYLPSKFADMVQDKPIRLEDLSGVKAAVQQWVAVLDPFLISMDPQEVKDYSNADLEKMWQSQGADKDRLVSFSRHFDAAVRGLQRLIRIDAWLSRTGRHLQVYSRILRRASRAVDSVSSDPYLLGLYLHRVKDAQELVTTALAEVAGSHVLLRQAFATSLASNAWGVIQHAVNLQYLLQQAVSKRRERLQKHDQLAEDLQRARSALAASQSKAKHSKYQLVKAKHGLIRHMARAKTSKAESARLSKALAASEPAHSIQKACASSLEVAVAELSDQSVQLQDSLSAAQQELLDTRQELEAAHERMAQLHDTCNDQASRSEVLEKELLQLQQQAEDAEQAVTDLEARYTAQMALWKRQYKAKVASLKDKQSSVMESYIKLQRMYNRELQAKQQSEAMRMDGEATIKELQQQLDHVKMSLTCASDSTTSIGSSRGCSDSEFCNGCWTDDDGDGSEDGSVSAFQSDSTCDACAVLTPRGALARYDELIDELSPSTCDIFFGGSNSNDGDGEVQATSECPTYIREFSNCGSSINVARVKAVNEFIDNYQDEPFCTCIATACIAAGCGGLTVRRLAGAAQHIQERMSQHSSWSAAAEDTFVHTVHGIVYDHSSKAAADDAAVGVQGMLNAEKPDLKDDLRSDSLVLSGAVWALNGSGPLLKQHDMQHILESVHKLHSQCGGSDPAELAVLFEALQHLGMELLPSPGASEAGSSLPEFSILLLAV